MAQDKGLSSLDKALIAARAADGKKATDIIIQDVRDLVDVTDYFVIVTAQNNRQISAVLNAIEEEETEVEYRWSHEKLSEGKIITEQTEEAAE